MKVVSCADRSSAVPTHNEPATATMRHPVAGSQRVMKSEPVTHRDLQHARQDRTREEHLAGAPADEAQTWITLLEPLGLIHVEKVGADRDAARGNDVLRPKIEVRVRRQ